MTTLTGTITQETARFIVETTYDDLPEALRAESVRCIVDGLGVMLAGAPEECTQIIHRYVGTLGVSGAARAPGHSASYPAEFAALAAGVSGHAHDFDDTQLASTPDRVYGLLTHPTVPALSAALAVGQETGATGKDLLRAFSIGLEVECKLAEAVNPQHYQRGFHSTGTFGVFGSAAAAASLIGLDHETTRTALSIAASKSAGLRVNFGTMTKPYHSGAAAQNGVVAAKLASLGYSADPSGLDGQWGFFAVAGGGIDEEYVLGKLGRPWSLLDPGVSVKPYPCGSLLHPAMDALRGLLIEHDVDAGRIREVRLGTASNVLNALRYAEPENALQGKFSIQFMLGVLALRRRAGIAEFRDEVVRDPGGAGDDGSREAVPGREDRGAGVRAHPEPRRGRARRRDDAGAGGGGVAGDAGVADVAGGPGGEVQGLRDGGAGGLGDRGGHRDGVGRRGAGERGGAAGRGGGVGGTNMISYPALIDGEPGAFGVVFPDIDGIGAMGGDGGSCA